MLAAIERIVHADGVVVVDVPAQAGDQAVAIRLRLARRQQADRVERIAVVVQVTAEEGRSADIADLAIDLRAGRVGVAIGIASGRIDVAPGFLADDRAAAIGLHILEARVDGEDEIVGQGEARVRADIAGVRRVVALLEIAAAGVGEVGDAGPCHLVDLTASDRVVALVRVEREAVGRGRADVAGAGYHARRVEDHQIVAQRQRAAEIVAVLVVVAGERDEVAIVAERLEDAGVILLLVDDAAVAVDEIVGRHARRREGARPRGGERAGVDHAEGAEIVAVLEPAIGSLDAGGEFLERTAGAEVDGAAGGRGGRAVDVGRAEADIDLLDDLRVEQLVREERVIAGVVQWNAVERLARCGCCRSRGYRGCRRPSRTGRCW